MVIDGREKEREMVVVLGGRGGGGFRWTLMTGVDIYIRGDLVRMMMRSRTPRRQQTVCMIPGMYVSYDLNNKQLIKILVFVSFALFDKFILGHIYIYIRYRAAWAHVPHVAVGAAPGR